MIAVGTTGGRGFLTRLKKTHTQPLFMVSRTTQVNSCFVGLVVTSDLRKSSHLIWPLIGAGAVAFVLCTFILVYASEISRIVWQRGTWSL
jgi:hypothetical protein